MHGYHIVVSKKLVIYKRKPEQIYFRELPEDKGRKAVASFCSKNQLVPATGPTA